MEHSCVEGLTGILGGIGNTGSDPLFVARGYWDDGGTPDDPEDDEWIDGDYRLLAGSPAIDAGVRSNWPYYVLTDLDGQERFVDDPDIPNAAADRYLSVDLGPYEFQLTTPGEDCNGNGVGDNFDLFYEYTLDLGDLAVGGDGTGIATRGTGLNPRTGTLVAPDVFGGEDGEGPSFITTDGTNNTVDLPAVNGVFVPNGITPIDNRGTTFEFPATGGYGVGRHPPRGRGVRRRTLTIDPWYWSRSKCRTRSGFERPGIGMNTNAGITFDLACHRSSGAGEYGSRGFQAVDRAEAMVRIGWRCKGFRRRGYSWTESSGSINPSQFRLAVPTLLQ